MTDDTDDRADRLRQRRGSVKKKAEQAADDDKEMPESTSTEPEPTSMSSSIKTEREEKMLYLLPEQKKELDHIYNRLKTKYEYEYDESFEKNRHFYPLVVKYGLDDLSGQGGKDSLDAQDIKERLSEVEV